MSSCKNDKLLTSSNCLEEQAVQPEAGSGTETEASKPVLERRQIFQPALSIQRYQWVQGFLEKREDIRSITDLGCGNGRMLLWLKSIKQLESIKLIDKDASELEPDFNSHLQPGTWDMIFGRKECDKPLKVEVYHGDLSVPNEALRSDCFTLVEVVEHLEAKVVRQCIRTVFHYYRPKLVIVTTPNSEFNHLLRCEADEPADTFRHSDHKFEWTRAQFREWCEGVIKQVNNSYSYELHGVGQMSNSEPFGPCTQIACFARLPTLEEGEGGEKDDKETTIIDTDEPPPPPPPTSRKATELVLDYLIPGSRCQEENHGEKRESYESW